MIGQKRRQENSQHASTRVYQNKDENSKSTKENQQGKRILRLDKFWEAGNTFCK